MKNSSQKIKGNDNVQIGVNYGQIINTQSVRLKTNVIHDPNVHITDSQALQIRNKIEEFANMLSADDDTKRPKTFAKVYSSFYKAFNVTAYKLLPKERFEEALMWLQKMIAIQGKKSLKRAKPEAWRIQQYKAIYTRSATLGFSKEELLIYAATVLMLKKPISSLKELSDTRLQKLYNKVFSMK